MKLAFTGEAGSGKDYIASILTKQYNFVRVSFSDQLKKLGATIFPWLEKDYPPEKKELPLNITLETGEVITKSPRDIWLELNNLRNIEDNLFVRMLENETKLLFVDNILVSDIRTEAEFEWCKKNGYQTVYVKSSNPIHERNSFDDYARSLEGKTDFLLENDMNGEEFVHEFMHTLSEIESELNIEKFARETFENY